MNGVLKGLINALGGNAVVGLLVTVLASKGADGAQLAATVSQAEATKIAAQFGIHDDAGTGLIVQDFRDLGAQVGKVVGHLLNKGA